MSGPFLTSDRLEYWMPQAGDWREIHEIVTHPDTGRYLGPPDDPPRAFERFQRNAGSWVLHGYGMLMLRLPGDPRIIGTAGIFHSFRGLGDDFDDESEAGWIFRHDIGGQGYATEAMRTIYDWFDEEHGLKRTVCMIAQGNDASMALARKMSFIELRTTEMDGDRIDLFERVPG